MHARLENILFTVFQCNVYKLPPWGAHLSPSNQLLPQCALTFSKHLGEAPHPYVSFVTHWAS